jgi:hypothetical protein
MKWGRNDGGRSGWLRRFVAHAGAALAAILYVTAASTGVGYASDPNSSAPSETAEISNATGTHRVTERHPAAPGPTARPNSVMVTASPYLVLTATSLDALGLTYDGTFAVSRPSGPVEVLRFTLSTGSLGGMRFTQACTAGVTTVTSASSASLGSTTFNATSIAMTVGDTPLNFTAANPPTTAFPKDILLRDLTLIATTMSSDTLSTPSFATQTAGC